MGYTAGLTSPLFYSASFLDELFVFCRLCIRPRQGYFYLFIIVPLPAGCLRGMPQGCPQEGAHSESACDEERFFLVNSFAFSEFLFFPEMLKLIKSGVGG